MPKDSEDQRPHARNRSMLIGAVLFLALGFAFLFFPVGKWLNSFKHKIEALGWIGPIAFVLLYALLTVALIPGSALTIGAGTLFGLGWGTVLTVIASNLGALGSFLLARTLMHNRVEEWAKEQKGFEAAREAVGKGGFHIILLLRLSPVFPFTLLNYLLGLTRVSIAHYMLGGLVGMLPGTVAFVYLGTIPTVAAGGLHGEGSAIRYALYGLGGIATIAATVILGRLTKKELEKQMRS